MRLLRSLLPALALVASAGCFSRCHRISSDWPHPAGAPWKMVLRANSGDRTSVVLEKGEVPPTALHVYGLRSSEPAEIDTSAGAATACGRPKVAITTPSLDPAIGVVGSVPTAVIPHPASNPAAAVEKAQWRIQGIVDGTSDAKKSKKKAKKSANGTDGAETLHVRSLVKTRRESAPPVFVASADQGCLGIVAILDKRATKVLASDQFRMPGPECAPLVTVPPADLDGDGHDEVVVRSGDGEAGFSVFRGVYRLTWSGDTVHLDRIWGDTLDGGCTGS
jgi:hypothetical protein